mmetsp:Transcript_104770/g.163300  ORF Transcript_104770/g.163300 Transcript_104770/m.163300 type:complete len:675 (+) Transcript_104770:85-2109(+)
MQSLPYNQMLVSTDASNDDEAVDVGNFKSVLNEMVMKVIQRPLSAGDITYSSALMTLEGGVPMYSARVIINALDGKEFEGPPHCMRKNAEQAAAQVALNELSVLPKSAGKLANSSNGRSQANNKPPNYKGRLQEFLVQDRMKARIFGAKSSPASPVEIAYRVTVVQPEPGRPSVAAYFSTVVVSQAESKADFRGDICRDRKAAEQSAAHKALLHFLNQENIHSVVEAPSRDLGSVVAPKASAKSELNELVMKVLARPAANEDILYEMLSQGPYKVAVRVPSLSPEMKFEGEAFPQKKSAEQSAAEKALKYYRSLPQVPRAVPSAISPLPASSSTRAPSGTDHTSLASIANVERRVQAPSGNLPVIDAKNGNHKSALNEFVMKLAGRPLASGDITYAVRQIRPGSFQATARIPVIDDMEFAAAPRTRKRDAEQCAAQIALLYYQAKFPGGAMATVQDSTDADGQSNNFKSALNELAMRAAARPLGDNDIVYIVRAVSTGHFQAIVKPLVIDPNLQFQGEVCTRKKDAEQKAACEALEHFRTSPPPHRLVGQSPAPPTPKIGLGGTAGDGATRFDTAILASTDVQNYKSALNELVMRVSGRPLTKDDIAYLSRPSGNQQFITSVKVMTLDTERDFEGQPRSRKRDAEQQAAKAALEHFQSQPGQGRVPAPQALGNS